MSCITTNLCSPGDSFHTKQVGQDYVDLTEDGSTMRYFVTTITTDMFNQKDELVCGR